MITSLLDQDFYTFTVGEAVFTLFPTMEVEYEFRCRNDGIVFSKEFEDEFQMMLLAMDGMCFRLNEIEYLKTLGLSAAYISFLSDFNFRPSQHIFWKISEEGKLDLIIKGTMAHVIFYEVIVLALINESYFNANYPLGRDRYQSGEQLLLEKIELIKNHRADVRFYELGTRRRRSGEWQQRAYHMLLDGCPNSILGTSNVLMAKTFGQRPVGTQSHQWYQIFQVAAPLDNSLKAALDAWLLVHRGRYAVALTDIVGSVPFYKNLDPLHWHAYTGFRGDSGDNGWWLNLTEKSMLVNDIDPQSKDVYLSNALDVRDSLELNGKWQGTFRNLNFCIGTKFTNHFPEFKALNIVIKPGCINGLPVAKISDDEGKVSCPAKYHVDNLRLLFPRE